MKKKGELETNLFDKAMEWYQSGDSGKKAAALELFPESMLEKEIEGYRKRNKTERLKLRDEELKQTLERAKKLFPIGTLLWSDDGCEHCPLLVVGEPYIGSTKYNTHIPYDKYHYFEDQDVEKKTVLAHAIRICHGSVDEENPNFRNTIIGLEKILIEMDKPEKDRYPKKNFFVDLESYSNMELETKVERIGKLEQDIDRYLKEIYKWKSELFEWKAYDPHAINPDVLKEMLKKWKW